MNKKLSTSSAISMIIVSWLVFGLIYAYTSSHFGLPKWIEVNILVINIWITQEIWSRLDPKKQETRFGYIFQANLKDRSLVFISLLVMVISDLVEGFYLRQITVWLGLLLSLVNFWLIYLIINLFASTQFKHTFNQKIKLW
jgi:hypothetical protein